MQYVALVLSVFGIVLGWLAWRAAQKSAGAAETSADAAKRSAEVAERAERRAIESHDVEWVMEPATDMYGNLNQVVTVINIGQDTAYDVLLTIDVNGQRFENKFETFAPRMPFSLDVLTPLRDAQRAASLESAASEAIQIIQPRWEVRGRARWVTPSGNEKLADLRPRPRD